MRAQPVINPNLPSSIEKLIEALHTTSQLDSARAAEWLADIAVDAEQLAPWYHFDHSVRDSYGRILLQRGANFELMLMSWAPGDYSAIHDHGAAEWGAVRYFGYADHVLFRERDDVLSIEERMTMQPHDVFPVDHTLIHLMGNPTDLPIASLHLYGRTQVATTITGGARIFDLCEQRIQRTDGGVFFCLPEHEINSREPCPMADTPTRRLHHTLMLQRIDRILAENTTDPVLDDKAQRLRHEINGLPGAEDAAREEAVEASGALEPND